MQTQTLSISRWIRPVARAAPRPAARSLGPLRVACAAGAEEERVYFVTGATDGIGKHTAKKFAALPNSRVLLHGRSLERGERAMEEIQKATGNTCLEYYNADLSLMANVHDLADQVLAKHGRLDVMINNAGVYETTRVETADGYEMTWAVNVMAPFLLTWRLLEPLRASPAARLINVSSISQTEGGGRLEWDNLQHERFYEAHSAYGLSKLCAVCFTYDLAERLADANITVNTLDPGTVNTKMLLAGWGRCGINVGDANNQFKLATDPELATVTGKYFVGGREARSCAQTHDEEARRKLWGILEEQTGAYY